MLLAESPGVAGSVALDRMLRWPIRSEHAFPVSLWPGPVESQLQTCTPPSRKKKWCGSGAGVVRVIVLLSAGSRNSAPEFLKIALLFFPALFDRAQPQLDSAQPDYPTSSLSSCSRRAMAPCNAMTDLICAARLRPTSLFHVPAGGRDV